MSTEAELKELSNPEFWNTRYASSSTDSKELEAFEWFRDFSKLKSFFKKHLPETPCSELILHLGCGNSTLTADLNNLGYENQLSVDFSEVVIEAMSMKYEALKGCIWKVMDVRTLDGIGDQEVGFANDKGTLDAFLYGSLWDPPSEVRENVGAYVDQAARVLKPGGKWLYITYRQPHFMKPLLLREGIWDLEVEVLEDPDGAGGFEYFGFIMTKFPSN